MVQSHNVPHDEIFRFNFHFVFIIKNGKNRIFNIIWLTIVSLLFIWNMLNSWLVVVCVDDFFWKNSEYFGIWLGIDLVILQLYFLLFLDDILLTQLDFIPYLLTIQVDDFPCLFEFSQ